MLTGILSSHRRKKTSAISKYQNEKNQNCIDDDAEVVSHLKTGDVA